MRRAEIWTAAGGPDYAAKPRPVVILQDDQFNSNDSITICPLTTDVIEAPLFRLSVQPTTSNRLRTESRLMVDKVTTVPRTKLGVRVGHLGAMDMMRLDRAMVVFLGLAGA